MIKKTTQYFKDCFGEMSKVTWPTKNQAVILTVIVLIFCVIFSLFLGVLDYVFGFGFEELIKLAR